ncbi:hypothetical protein CEJ86_28770 [Sinorhizobium meliloti]|uniref:Uncharacterized protein n=2 Tax=Rhizobium meliloti TaxID=382 RepID=A0A2J0YV19_RHIML|nr:hypothetical protein CEJ86_28770 [Sinorhizobium meliloti]
MARWHWHYRHGAQRASGVAGRRHAALSLRVIGHLRKALPEGAADRAQHPDRLRLAYLGLRRVPRSRRHVDFRRRQSRDDDDCDRWPFDQRRFDWLLQFPGDRDRDDRLHDFRCVTARHAVFLLSRGKRSAIEGQIVPFLSVLATAILACTAWNISQGMSPPVALRLSAFNVTSIMTDTGFATADFSTWGSFAVGLFFMLYLVGGCAGSTAGAIKIFRWQILFEGVGRALRLMLYPQAIVPVRFQGKSVDDVAISNVRNFFFLYIMTLLFMSLLVMATGLDYLSAISSVAQAMANAGPGLGPVVGPATNFASIPDTAKWLIAFAMVIGRLELVTFLVVLQPWFWRR